MGFNGGYILRLFQFRGQNYLLVYAFSAGLIASPDDARSAPATEVVMEWDVAGGRVRVLDRHAGCGSLSVEMVDVTFVGGDPQGDDYFFDVIAAVGESDPTVIEYLASRYQEARSECERVAAAMGTTLEVLRIEALRQRAKERALGLIIDGSLDVHAGVETERPRRGTIAAVGGHSGCNSFEADEITGQTIYSPAEVDYVPDSTNDATTTYWSKPSMVSVVCNDTWAINVTGTTWRLRSKRSGTTSWATIWDPDTDEGYYYENAFFTFWVNHDYRGYRITSTPGGFFTTSWNYVMRP